MSGRWDNKNADNRGGFGSRKVILVLIGIMFSMWIVLGLITMYGTTAVTCTEIMEFIDTDEFYNMDSETKQLYIDASYDCARDGVIVR